MSSDSSLESPSRRVAPRVNATFPVEIVSTQGIHASHALNISASGLKLVTDRPLPSREVEVKFSLGHESDVYLKAQVVWQREVGSMGVNLTGLHFQLNGEGPEPLRDWLAERCPAA